MGDFLWGQQKPTNAGPRHTTGMRDLGGKALVLKPNLVTMPGTSKV